MYLNAFLVQNPREVAAFVYGCKKAMSCVSVEDGRFQNDLKFIMLEFLIEYTSGCSPAGYQLVA